MVVLKKLKSATLMEAIVATVLIVIIFIVASLILNNVLLNAFARHTHKINYKMNELEYSVTNKQLTLPYEEDYQGWNITVKKDSSENAVVISALNQKDKEIVKKRMYGK